MKTKTDHENADIRWTVYMLCLVWRGLVFLVCHERITIVMFWVTVEVNLISELAINPPKSTKGMKNCHSSFLWYSCRQIMVLCMYPFPIKLATVSLLLSFTIFYKLQCSAGGQFVFNVKDKGHISGGVFYIVLSWGNGYMSMQKEKCSNLWWMANT